MKHVTPDQWLYVLAPFLIYGAVVAVLSLSRWEANLRENLHRNSLVIFFKSISAGLERTTGYPGWAMAGALSGLCALGTAAVDLCWDVTWYIGFRRPAAFVRNTTLLLREQHPGPAWPGVVGYGGLASMAALWSALFAFVAHRFSGAGPALDWASDDRDAWPQRTTRWLTPEADPIPHDWMHPATAAPVP